MGQTIIPQVVFTPLVAGWSIWLGMAVSSRVSDVRTAQQFGALASLPSIGVSTVIALKLIPAKPAPGRRPVPPATGWQAGSQVANLAPGSFTR